MVFFVTNPTFKLFQKTQSPPIYKFKILLIYIMSLIFQFSYSTIDWLIVESATSFLVVHRRQKTRYRLSIWSTTQNFLQKKVCFLLLYTLFLLFLFHFVFQNMIVFVFFLHNFFFFVFNQTKLFVFLILKTIYIFK
jgi:hypothetical protein